MGAVVDRDKKAAVHPGGRPAQQVGIRVGRHKGVNQTFGHHPAPADVPLIKHAGVLRPVPCLDRLGQAQVVIHRKVQVQQVLGAGLQNPAFVEPVLRPLRVAVEPELGTVHRTAGGGLVYKAFRHQGNFVKQCARQCNALDQVLAALVLATEQVVIVGHGPAGHDQQIVAPALGGSVAAGGQHLLEHPHHVAPQAGNGLAAQGKVLAVKARHAPQHKTEGERNGFAGADGSVRDQPVRRLYGGGTAPPGQYLLLAAAERPEPERGRLNRVHPHHPSRLRAPAAALRSKSRHQWAGAVLRRAFRSSQNCSAG